MVTHLSGYQLRDHEVVDYHMWQLPGTELWFRGPKKNLRPKSYVACVGAAQTFGCLCERPFPLLLEERLNIPVLNLGYGGAGPAFFYSHKELHKVVNDAAFVIVQVLSGRSADNSLFESNGLEYLTRRADGARLSAHQAWEQAVTADTLRCPDYLPQKLCGLVARANRCISRIRTRRLVNETLANYQMFFELFLKSVTPPKILFWFSRRHPNYRRDFRSGAGVLGEFPQLVDGLVLRKLAPLTWRYVECVTSRGTPHQLRSRFTGLPAAVDPAKDRPDLGGTLIALDAYYPSPEMHEDAAQALEPHCNELLSHLTLSATP